MPNPLQNKTLEIILNELVDYYGWELLGQDIKIKCFITNPSIKSSLIFLRKTPWARTKVEDLYIDMIQHKNQLADQMESGDEVSVIKNIKLTGDAAAKFSREK